MRAGREYPGHTYGPNVHYRVHTHTPLKKGLLLYRDVALRVALPGGAGDDSSLTVMLFVGPVFNCHRLYLKPSSTAGPAFGVLLLRG